jgi:hypothetical protein
MAAGLTVIMSALDQLRMSWAVSGEDSIQSCTRKRLKTDLAQQNDILPSSLRRKRWLRCSSFPGHLYNTSRFENISVLRTHRVLGSFVMPPLQPQISNRGEQPHLALLWRLSLAGVALHGTCVQSAPDSESALTSDARAESASCGSLTYLSEMAPIGIGKQKAESRKLPETGQWSCLPGNVMKPQT